MTQLSQPRVIDQEGEVTPLILPLPKALQTLGGMGRSTFYEHVDRGDITTVKIGRRVYVAYAELQRFVDAVSSRRQPIAS